MNKIYYLLALFLWLSGSCWSAGAQEENMPKMDERVIQGVQKNLELFDQSMDPGYLDRALEELGRLPDHDDCGVPMPEVRRFKLQTYFRIFRLVTESVDVNYLPEMARQLMERETDRLPEEVRPIPEKVASSYLYDYLQSGLRIFRFQVRIMLLDYIRSAYRGIPSPEERREILLLAGGTDQEFLSFLEEWTQTDVTWTPDKGAKNLRRMAREERMGEMVHYLLYIHFLNYARDPLYLEKDYATMNIAPPSPVGNDEISIAGQAPDSIKEPESRRQYLIALRENTRKSRGRNLFRKIQDQQREAGRKVLERMGSCELMDRESRHALLQVAEKLGLEADFRDNLRDACESSDIDEAVALFEKTKDRKDLEAADALIGKYRPCRKEWWGKSSSSFFQLERWLRLNHVLATETEWPDRDEIRKNLEGKMMENIWKTCGKSRFYLQEAAFWLQAYGLKSAAASVRQECRNILKEEERKIEEQLLLLGEKFSPELLKETERSVTRLTHRNYQRNKNIPDILDFKLCSLLRLMSILESNLDSSYEYAPQHSLVFGVVTENAEGECDMEWQKKLWALYNDLRHSLENMVKYDYDDSPETQQRALKILRERNVRPECLHSFRHYFEEKNLGLALQELREKGAGNPEQLWRDIRRWANGKEEDPEWPHKRLVVEVSWGLNLLVAMHHSGNLGPEGFDRNLQESLMAELNSSLPNDWEGLLALENILLGLSDCPLEASLRSLVKNRRDAKAAVFSEQLTLFEENGDLEALEKGFEAMGYIMRDGDEGEQRLLARRETTDAYLRMLRALVRFRPEELVKRQKLPPGQWGKGWNEQIPPVQRMELLLKNWAHGVRSRFFSHIRYHYGKTSEEMEEVRRLLRHYGMDDQFCKEVEERLAGKEWES